MDCILITQQYVNEMIRLAGPGMKIMLMDKDTTSIISCAHTQSEMMQKEVYLFERIDSGLSKEPMKFLKCIVFVRPSHENIQLLCDELRIPKYAQYYLYFSNVITKADLKLLAESDEQETVREVREFYADVIPLAPHFTTLNIQYCYDQSFALDTDVFRRILQALTALCLSLKKKPTVRYQRISRNAQKLAEELVKISVRDDTLFENCQTDAVLLIIERSEDSVSPLLNQWTYEAMVHELIGLNNNRVILDNTSLSSTDGQQNLVLNAQNDEFYAKNMYLNFGDIGQNIKTLINDYQKKTKTHQQLESITDMKKFIEQYPQFKKITGTVSKHVQLVGELSRIVTEKNLLEISELEQNIAVGNADHSFCFESIQKLLQNPKLSEMNALRLAMLYALRFENNSSNSLNNILDLMRKRWVSRQNQLLKNLLEYAGQKRRQSDLFGNRSAIEMTKKFIKGLKGVENIYTQHEPYIVQLIELIARGKLPESQFPSENHANLNSRFDNVIIFIIGGSTYVESAAIASINRRRANALSSQNAGSLGSLPPKVVLCSNFIHNTKSFMSQLMRHGQSTTLPEFDANPSIPQPL